MNVEAGLTYLLRHTVFRLSYILWKKSTSGTSQSYIRQSVGIYVECMGKKEKQSLYAPFHHDHDHVNILGLLRSSAFSSLSVYQNVAMSDCVNACEIGRKTAGLPLPGKHRRIQISNLHFQTCLIFIICLTRTEKQTILLRSFPLNMY